MKTLRLWTQLLIAALMVTACGGGPPTPTPFPSAPPGATAPAIRTATPVPAILPTKAPTLPPESFAPLATATLQTVSSVVVAGEFTNPEYGVALSYPQLWAKTPADISQGTLLHITEPGQDVSLIVFYTDLGTYPLDESAQVIADSSLGNLFSVQREVDGLVTLATGDKAWQILATAEFDNGEPVKVNITTISGGGHTFTAMAFGLPENYNRHQSEIESIINSLQYTGQSLYGISRSEALVISGYQSNNPRDYDPATMHGGADGMVYNGLVSFDPSLNVIPELAESWTVTGGTVYTFTLRANAQFHNGRPLTANDVVYSWERAADPATESDTVLTYLGDIVGVKEMQSGEADHISGLKVIDDQTLEVTLDAPKPYFLYKLTFPTGYIVDRYNVESGADWYMTPNGAGPYKFMRWEPFQVMLFERFEDYVLGPPPIRYIVMRLFAGDSQRLYETGDIDITGVSLFSLPRFQDPDEPMSAELHSAVNLCTGYINFDTAQAPFDDVKVRQAFSMAFDREKYIDVLYNGLAIPANGLYPPGLPGYNLGLEPLPYNPEAARQLLADSSYGSAEALPPIVYTTGGFGSYAGGNVGALAQMWEQTLGITLTVENLEPDRYLDEVNNGRHGQIFDGGWCADYPDPENFADALFHTGAQQNDSNYSNPELDAVLDSARVETDVTTRINLYQQAETIIVNDAPVLFLVHSQSYILVKPYIEGTLFTPMGLPAPQYWSINPDKMK